MSFLLLTFACVGIHSQLEPMMMRDQWKVTPQFHLESNSDSKNAIKTPSNTKIAFKTITITESNSTLRSAVSNQGIQFDGDVLALIQAQSANAGVQDYMHLKKGTAIMIPFLSNPPQGSVIAVLDSFQPSRAHLRSLLSKLLARANVVKTGTGLLGDPSAVANAKVSASLIASASQGLLGTGSGIGVLDSRTAAVMPSEFQLSEELIAEAQDAIDAIKPDVPLTTAMATTAAVAADHLYGVVKTFDGSVRGGGDSSNGPAPSDAQEVWIPVYAENGDTSKELSNYFVYWEGDHSYETDQGRHPHWLGRSAGASGQLPEVDLWIFASKSQTDIKPLGAHKVPIRRSGDKKPIKEPVYVQR